MNQPKFNVYHEVNIAAHLKKTTQPSHSTACLKCIHCFLFGQIVYFIYFSSTPTGSAYPGAYADYDTYADVLPTIPHGYIPHHGHTHGYVGGYSDHHLHQHSSLPFLPHTSHQNHLLLNNNNNNNFIIDNAASTIGPSIDSKNSYSTSYGSRYNIGSYNTSLPSSDDSIEITNNKSDQSIELARKLNYSNTYMTDVFNMSDSHTTSSPSITTSETYGGRMVDVEHTSPSMYTKDRPDNVASK